MNDQEAIQSFLLWVFDGDGLKVVIGVGFALLIFVASRLKPREPQVVRIAAMADGRILLDGRSMEPQFWAPHLESARRQAKAVWCYRELPSEGPIVLSDQIHQLMDLVGEKGLPVAFFADRDCTIPLDHGASELAGQAR